VGFLDSLKKKVEARASQVYDQVNMLDNGRSYQQRTPTNNRSVVGQLTHNGATNTAGNMLVKPIYNTVAASVDAGTMMGRSLAGAPLDQQLSAANAFNSRWHGSIPGFLADQGINAGKTVMAVPRALQGDVMGGSLAPQTGNKLVNNAGFLATNPIGFAMDKFAHKGPHAPTKEQSAAYNQGMQSLNKTVVGQMVSPVEAAYGDLGGKDAKAQLKAGGYDTERTGAAKYFADPVMGAVGTYGLLKGGEQAVKGGKNMMAVRNTTKNASLGQLVDETLAAKPTPVPIEKPVAAAPAAIAKPVEPTAVPPVDNPAIPLENAPVNGKLSRFANKTVPKSDEVSPELQKMVAQEKVGYDPHTNAGRIAAADEWLGNKTPQDAYAEVVKSFENEKTVNDQHVVNAIQAAKKLDESGKEADLHMATEIYDNLSRHLSKKGQEIQAASLLSNRTPQGLYYAAQKALRTGGIDPGPHLTTLKGMTDKIKSLEPGSEARDYAIKEMQQYVGRQIPAPMLDKMISTWKAGLLTGVKTVTGNALSNGTFRGMHELSKPLAVALDQGISAFTKKRSQAMTYKGTLSGAGEGFQKGWQYFKTGIDERSGITNKFMENGGREVNFGKGKAGRVMSAYVNGVFRNMAAQDRPFFYSQLRNSLAELATVDGKNAGLRGKALRDHVETTMKSPSMEMMQIAKNEAERSVLANHTALSHLANSMRQSVDRMDPGIARSGAKVAIETTMPFTGVPSAFVARVMDFTPAGPLRLAVDKLVYKKEITQRDFTNSLAEATTGTAVMWMGAELAKNNVLSGAYPNDPKEQALWKAERKTPNSIKINGRWISLNYLGPTGMLLNAGARANDAKEGGAGFGGQVGAAAGGMPKDLTQQSFLQGVNNAVSAVNDPGRYLGNYVKSQAGSIIPTLVNDVGNATDSQQRDRNGVVQAVESRIPGVRRNLPATVDVFGNPLKAGSNPIDRMINPLRPSSEVSNPMFKEINRLNEQGVAVMPTTLDKKQSFDGQKVPLTDAQRRQLQINVGQNTQKLWNEAMQGSDYKNLSDDGKKKMLDSIYQTVLEGEKRKYSSDNSVGQFNNSFTGQGKKATANTAAYIDGSLDIAKFAKEPGTSSGGTQLTINKSLAGNNKTILKGYNNMDTTQRNKWFDSANDNEFKYAQAKYENDKANGTLTKAQDARAKYDLAQSKVGSSYTKEVRDLYGLNKTELYSLLTSDPKGTELANQLVAYGDQLEAAGLGNNKWRDSKGNVAIAPKSRSSSGSKSKAAKKVPTTSLVADSISQAGKLNKAAASAKVSKGATVKGMSVRGIQAFKKTTTGGGPTKVAAAKKKQLKLARSIA
jgi:hypothetical protein